MKCVTAPWRILDELDRDLAQAGQELGLRTSHEQTVGRRRAVLHQQLVAGDRDDNLPSPRARRSRRTSRGRPAPTSTPPVRCGLLCSFSQMSSSSSVSATNAFSMRSVNGLAKVFGSSKVISSSMWPKSRRRNRSVIRRRLGLRMPADVEPPQVVETGGIDDQRVLFPVSDRVAQPRGIRILRKLPAIGEDGSVRTVRRLMEDHDQSRGLDNPGHAAEIEERDADRQAARQRAVLPEVLDPLQAQGLGPGLNVLRLQGLGDVVVVAILTGPPGPPNARQVRFALRRPRRRRGKVRLAVRQAGDARRRIVDPLCSGGRGQHAHQRSRSDGSQGSLSSRPSVRGHHIPQGPPKICSYGRRSGV